MKPKILFFDCDGVLIFGDPWARMHEALGIPQEIDQKWYWDYYNGKLKFDDWTALLVNEYKFKGLHQTLYEQSMMQFSYNPEIEAMLPYLKSLAIPIGIISSGTDFYVSKVAKKLGFDFWRANAVFHFDDDGTFTDFAPYDEDPKAKPKQIQAICKECSVDPVETMFVGDSINDLHAFKLTEHGVLYRPEKEEYKNYAWKVIEHLSEIKTLIS